MDYNFTINYPNSYNLLPTEDQGKFVGFREKNGVLQPIGVTISQSQPFINGNTEVVSIKVETIIMADFDPNN